MLEDACTRISRLKAQGFRWDTPRSLRIRLPPKERIKDGIDVLLYSSKLRDDSRTAEDLSFRIFLFFSPVAPYCRFPRALPMYLRRYQCIRK